MLAGSNGIGFIPHVIDVRAGEVENLHNIYYHSIITELMSVWIFLLKRIY